MIRTRSIPILAILMMLLAACGGESTPDEAGQSPPDSGATEGETDEGDNGDGDEPAEPQTMETIKLAYGVSSIGPSTAPWLSAAKTAGFWQEEGLDVQVTGFNGAGPALQLLANGQVDVVFTGTPILFQLKGEGAGIRAVASSYDRNHIYPVVSADSDIETIEEFEGKRLGILALTGSVPLWIEILLNEHGLTMDDFSEVTAVGSGAPAVEALQSGQIDVLAEWHGHYATLEESFGLEFRRFDEDPALTKFNFVQGFFVSEDLIESNPDAIEGLIRGVAKAVIFSDVNPEAAARGHFDQFPETIPTDDDFEEAVAQTGRIIKANVQLSISTAMNEEWGVMRDESVEAVRDALLDSDQLEVSLDPGDYYTNQFVEAANNFDPAEIVEFAESFSAQE